MTTTQPDEGDDDDEEDDDKDKDEDEDDRDGHIISILLCFICKINSKILRSVRPRTFQVPHTRLPKIRSASMPCKGQEQPERRFNRHFLDIYLYITYGRDSP